MAGWVETRGDAGRRSIGVTSAPVTALAALLVVLAFTVLLLPVTPAFAAAADGSESAGAVWVTEVKGIVDPAMAGYLKDTMEDAAKAGAAALVIKIDTPGGLDTSMRDIIQAEIDSPIPIVFYVHPQGARAASAGVYILMGADVAAMAPQTNLGAATPVSLSGDMDETMQAKVTNDAAAYIRGLATSHGRNADWAEQAVREAVSLPAEDALEQNVIDFVAADLPALLEAIDGYVTTPKNLTLHTAGAPIKEVNMGWIQRFLHAIANPDIAYVLMTIGVLGIIMELSTPGLGVAGIAGVISLLLAFYSFQVLPVSLVGVALVVLAMILYLAELKIQSHGILGIGGTAALIAGGLMLFDSPMSYLKVSWPVLIAVVAIVFVFFMIVIRAVTRAMRRPHATGLESMVGATGVALSPLTPQGQVRLQGETWKARTEGGDLPKDAPVEVLGTEGLTLIVRPRGDSEAAGEEKQADPEEPQDPQEG
ncbi:MAG: nodulation protein NfeD [Thermoleophilia bacterium]|nr:nodulation protein NfeD [Thermoleophilia bacterium]